MSGKDTPPPPAYSTATSGAYTNPSTQFNTSQPSYGMQQPPTYTYPTQGGYNMTSSSAVVVTQPGMGMQYQTVPQDYTTQAWIACLCCFWPTGLLAIMKANESRDALARGDLVGANTAADGARTMVRISWIAGIISIVVAVVIVVVYVVVILNSVTYNGY